MNSSSISSSNLSQPPLHLVEALFDDRYPIQSGESLINEIITDPNTLFYIEYTDGMDNTIMNQSLHS